MCQEVLGLRKSSISIFLWTVGVLPGPSVVEVRSPIAIVAVLHVIAVGLLCE